MNANLTIINQDIVNEIENYCYGLLNLNLSPSKEIENLNDYIYSYKGRLKNNRYDILLNFFKNIKNKINDLEKHRRNGGNAQNNNNQNSHEEIINPKYKNNNSSKNVNNDAFVQKTYKFVRPKK